MDSDGVIMHEALPFLYFYHASDCSVQCAIDTRNGEMTVLVVLSCAGTGGIFQECCI